MGADADSCLCLSPFGVLQPAPGPHSLHSGPATSIAWWPPALEKRAWTSQRQASTLGTLVRLPAALPSLVAPWLPGILGSCGARLKTPAWVSPACDPSLAVPFTDAFLPATFLTDRCLLDPPPLLWQVDLIVCFDATASPTRSVQRMGRTGRHKEGRVVYILAAGREEDKYKQIEEVGDPGGEGGRAFHQAQRGDDGALGFRCACASLGA